MGYSRVRIFWFNHEKLFLRVIYKIKNQKRAIGVILVYDISQKETFENMKNWYNELLLISNNAIEIVIVGHKNDIADEEYIFIINIILQKASHLRTREIIRLIDRNTIF